MIRYALKMLFGDKARYLGILVGVAFAALLITQQGAIFVGLMERTYSFVSDTPQPDLWVVDPDLEHHSDSKPLVGQKLFRVRGVDGVEWATPMFKAFTKMRLPSGERRGCIVIGVDDNTLVGAPSNLASGAALDLRRADAVLVDEADVNGKLAVKTPDGKRPIRTGDVLELNDHRAIVAGTFKINPSFFWDPVIYTTYTRAISYTPSERKQLSFILVKVRQGQDIAAVADRIERTTGLKAYTESGFKKLTATFILEKTGILINFGIAVILGFGVGTAVAGQTFYNFTMDNLRHFGALKALGTPNKTILAMVLTQALVVGFIGYGLGVGGAAVFGSLIGGTSLAFSLPWQLLVITAGAILIISILAAALSIRKVLVLEPGVVFRG
ncbi:MAG: ABC transporter permease [Phycisphaerales bacterium]|nr:ABC transporter permease [Phycisphaerales bacterium]